MVREGLKGKKAATASELVQGSSELGCRVCRSRIRPSSRQLRATFLESIRHYARQTLLAFSNLPDPKKGSQRRKSRIGSGEQQVTIRVGLETMTARGLFLQYGRHRKGQRGLAPNSVESLARNNFLRNIFFCAYGNSGICLIASSMETSFTL